MGTDKIKVVVHLVFSYWQYIPTQVNKPTKIQLFASTITGDNVLTINAPIQSDAGFNKTGLIVNEMMETLTVVKK